MKRLSLLLLAATLPLWADNPLASINAPPPLLANGDFSDGLAHWEGDVKAPPDNDDGSPGVGAGIKLRHSDWTVATHDFDLTPGTYKLHITFDLLPDTHFSTDIPDYINLKGRLGIPYNPNSYLEAQPGQWLAMVSDPTAQSSLLWRVDPTAKSGTQSYTFTIKGIEFKNRQTLMLAFPPGRGEVVLQKVSIDAVVGN